MTARTLLLLRHAKSSREHPGLDDFDRPLAARGREAAPRAGAEIERRGWLPDMALVSPAVRAWRTWELAARALPRPIPAVFERAIYLAPAERLLAAIRDTPDEVATLLVVGHNPGLEDLAALIAGPDSDAETLARLRRKFPTAALARLVFEGRWRGLGEGGARLDEFVTPKQLPRAP